MRKLDAKTTAYTSVSTALVTAATALIAIPVPAIKGYLNGGEAMIFVLAYFVGGFPSVVAAAIGSALADLILGFSIYAPFTFVIKGVECLALIALFRKRPTAFRAALSALLCSCIMVGGYFLTEWLLFGILPAVAGVLPNLAQGACGAVVAAVAVAAIGKNKSLEALIRNTNRTAERTEPTSLSSSISPESDETANDVEQTITETDELNNLHNN